MNANLVTKAVCIGVALIVSMEELQSQSLDVDVDLIGTRYFYTGQPIWITADGGLATYQIPVPFKVDYSTIPSLLPVPYTRQFVHDGNPGPMHLDEVPAWTADTLKLSAFPSTANNVELEIVAYQPGGGGYGNVPVIRQASHSTSVGEFLIDVEERINGRLPYLKVDVVDFYEDAIEKGADQLVDGVLGGISIEWLAAQHDLTPEEVNQKLTLFREHIRILAQSLADDALTRLYDLDRPNRKIRMAADDPFAGTVESTLGKIPSGLQIGTPGYGIGDYFDLDVSVSNQAAARSYFSQWMSGSSPALSELGNSLEFDAHYSVPFQIYDSQALSVLGNVQGGVGGVSFNRPGGLGATGAVHLLHHCPQFPGLAIDISTSFGRQWNISGGHWNPYSNYLSIHGSWTY